MGFAGFDLDGAGAAGTQTAGEAHFPTDNTQLGASLFN